jgi:hypothetical protein
MRTKRAQRNKEMRQAYQEYYFCHRPTLDIEGQVAQGAEDKDHDEEDQYLQPAIELHIPERAQLAEILCRQPDDLDGDSLHKLCI